jgi:hypothetical protein
MRTISNGVNPDPHADLGPAETELNHNYFITSSLRSRLREGKGWEGALVGLVRQALEVSPELNQPRWKIIRARNTSTTFEFESFAEWVSNPNALGLQDYNQLISLLEISPVEEGRALADRVRQELKLPVGSNRHTLAKLSEEVGGNNVTIYKEAAAEVRASERGNSAASVRRRIRNWIQQNPDADNLALAREWLAKLEANPRSREHQQALREIGIGKVKRVLDVSSVAEPLLAQLYELAQSEQMTVAEVLEDALAVYFRMEDQPEPEPVEAAPAVTDRPAEGFYRGAQIARLTGCNERALTASLSRSTESRAVLGRLLKDADFEVIAHPDNEHERRYEVRHKP